MMLLILWQTTEAFAQNLAALHDVDKGMGVDMVENRTQLNHIGAVESDIEHLALSALVETRAGDERATTLDVVDDVIAHSFGLIGNDEHGLVGLHTVDHEVDDLALDEDEEILVYLCRIIEMISEPPLVAPERKMRPMATP